jgi:putative flippase GtrA
MGYENKYKNFYEMLRFCIVGSVAVLIQFLAYLLLVNLFSYNVALPVSYVISMSFNYLLTTYFTFGVKVDIKKSIGFVLSHCVNFLSQIIFLNLFIWIGVNPKWAMVLVLAICVPINFILVRASMRKL